MEGKRPTRQRTSKEETKQGGGNTSLTPQPSGLGRAVSSSGPSAPTGVMKNLSTSQAVSQPRREPAGLLRSKSENPLQSKQQQSSSKHHHVTEDRHKHNKRKHKLKSKMKYVKEDSSASASVKDLGMNLHSLEEHKLSGPQKPHLLSSSLDSRNPSSLSAALQKLRERDSTRNNNHPQPFKKKKENSCERVGTTAALEEAIRREMAMAAKFEMVEVHPLYAVNRYACSIIGQVMHENMKVTFHQVNNVNPENFNVKLSSDPQKDLKYDDCVFLSKPFKLNYNDLSPSSKSHLSTHLGETFQQDINTNILVSTQVPFSHCSGPVPLVAFLPSRNEYLIVNLSAEANPLDALKELEEEDFKEEDYKMAYGRHTEEVIQKALKIFQAYNQYMNTTSKVNINKDNLEDALFTIVNYQTQDNISGTPTNNIALEESKTKTTKSGVFLRAKLDLSFYQEHLLFVRKLGGSYKQGKHGLSIGSHKEVRSEWLQFSKHRIQSDISKGFISINCLSSVNSDSSSRLRKRNLVFVSYRESLQQRKSIRHIANETIENSEVDRKAPLFKDSSMRPGDRCVLCNYQAQGYEHLRCSCCNKVYHEECIKREPKRLHQLYLGIRELNWRCHDCIRCVNCLSIGGKSQSQQLLNCKCCNSAYHFDCLDPNVKMSMPSIQPETSITNKNSSQANQSLPDIYFHCERCVQCDQCGAREAGKNRLNKWSKDFKLCSNCNKKRKKNQLCTVCESFWPDDILSDPANPEIQAQNPIVDTSQANRKINEYLNTKMINCGKCGIWVHYECDRIFEDEGIKKMFLNSKNGIPNDMNYGSSLANETLIYHCIDCKQQQRSILIRQIIENLANEDKQFYFQEPVEDLIHNYSKIIKTPMCFKYVKDRAKGLSSNHYLTDPSQLRKDISLIFDNAMKFNLPKHKVHKEAQRLGQVCTAVLDSIWTRLELNAQRTLDENKHKEWLRKQRRDNLRATLEETGQKLLRVKDEPFQAQRALYSLKLEELFDQSEYQPGSNEQAGDTGGLMMTSQDAIRRYGGDGFEEDEDMNSQEDDDEDLEENEYDEELESEGVPGSDREFYAQKRSKQKGTGNNHKKRDLRTRKNVDYNEEKAEILGKRGYVGGNDEGQHRIGNSQYSSKKARYQQQSAQYASQLSFNSIKGASLLQQALHQQEKQMQSQHIEGNQSSQNLSTLQYHASADQAKNMQQEYQAQIIKLQEIDDERCYYSNPARCSFDDPCLVFEEMCYLCGSFGKRKDFLSCTLCGESFHTYCLQLLPANSNEDNDDSSPVMLTEEEEQALIAKFQPYWKCLNCKFCDICSSATQEAFLLYCDVCDKAFHSFCWTPQLKLIPKCQWKCSECFKCTKCGTHRFFDPALHFKPGSNLLLEHIIQSCQNDFEFSQNFSLCYECGMNEHKKSFCKICQSTHIQLGNSANLEDGAAGGAQQQQVLFVPQLNNMGRKKDGGQKNAQKQNEKMLKCKSCGYYCHVKCSRLLPQIEEDSEEQQDEFKCLECLLTGKSINHLIRESCEHYENMHQIINRHRLLSYLLSEILTPYFPQQEKAPLFIKAFIEQNQDLFKKDPVIIDWLSLLETGVVYNQPGGQLENEESTNNATADHLMRIDSKETFQTSKKLEEADLQAFAINEIYQSTVTLDTIQKTPAQESYQKMFGHKESFLPAKRNLYDALASDEGHHRFGQRNHFMDPFSEETQSLITLPVQENLEKDVNFARLYVEYELKAVMKVKLHFFDWFEEMLRGIVERSNNRQNKKKSVIVSKQEDSQSLQAIDQSHENANLQSFIMGVQDPPSSNIGERVNHPHNHHQANNANEMCFDEDILIDNPQKRLQCVMCKLKGELKVTGRLIPFQVNQFVHVNCALWSTDVHEIAEGGYLINFFQIWNTRAKFQKCNQCGENGASLFCSSSRTRCQVAYHFPCAYRNKKMAFAPRDVKETICDLCCKFTRGVHPGLPLEHANTKRRFQIAKNQQPWNMTHHMTNLALQTQSLQQALFNSGTTSAADIEKPLQIEKWRPFFFDMFNRVGNMTILSLRKEINQIIEEYCTQTRSSANSEQNLKDFSTVRIYWRHFELDKEEVMPKDQQSVGTDVEMIDTSKSQWGKESKGFYLYSNNQIKELVYRDLEALLPYVCFRVKDKVDLGLHYSSLNPTKLQQVAHLREQNFQGFISASTFWQKLLNHYTMERARFSLNNIIFSLSEFTGKTKYPVSIWNRCPEGMKNKAFFLRAGEQVLGSQHPLGITHAQGVGQDKDQVREASFSGQITNGGASSVQGFGNIRKVDPFKATNIDDIFKRMTKINQMGEHQNPMASIKRVNASKHLPYEAVLHNLGKKMFYKAPPQNSSLFEDANLSGLKPQKGQNQQQQQESGPAKPKGLQKKARQADTVGSGQGGQGVAGGEVNAKESDLPIAMKYRLSKTQPKTVEVGPSKIHRNGLFTLEDLSANDIVIEYVGERIRNKVADKRELVYEQKGIGDCYLFRLDKEYIIDATFHGNKARYLNHSCDANCSAKIINVQQQKHIIICANRQIKSGEELTYNYNFDYEADKIECFCGAPGCLGRLN